MAAADVAECPNRLEWWEDQGELPHWQAAARIVVTISPSPAAAERVFSLLQVAVEDNQESMLEEQIEATLCNTTVGGMLCYDLIGCATICAVSIPFTAAYRTSLFHYY